MNNIGEMNRARNLIKLETLGESIYTTETLL